MKISDIKDDYKAGKLISEKRLSFIMFKIKV